MILRVIDIETTGMEPPAEVIEVGFTDVSFRDGEAAVLRGDSCLYGVLREIPPETMAVHHITPAMLAGRPTCSRNDLRSFFDSGQKALVAHNASFEGQWFTPEVLGGLPLICTYKAALRVWPDAPGHGNQVLRYWLGLDLPDSLAMPPHRAKPDAFVTAHVLVELLRHATLDELIAWTAEPRLMPKLTFGKHKDKRWPDVPPDYLSWVVSKSDLDPDTKWNAQRELERRRAPRRQAPVQQADPQPGLL